LLIFVQREGGKLEPLNETGFPKEADLQQFFFEHPEALPLMEIKAGVRFVILGKEIATLSGSVDLLMVDNDGELYIVETKLFRNPDKREVLAQVLDYGAAIWDEYADQPQDFVDYLGKRLGGLESLVSLLAQEFDDPDSVLEGIKKCIASGNFRFVVLMDAVPAELRRLVQFVNSMSRFVVYAVEVKHYLWENLHIYVQNVYGPTSRPPIAPPRTRWDEEKFFQDLAERTDPQVVEAVKKVLAFCRDHGANIHWGTGKDSGSLIPKFSFKEIGPRAPFFIRSNGYLVVQFGLSLGAYSTLWKTLLLQCLSEILPFRQLRISTEGIKQFPELPPEVWVPSVDEFLNAISTFLWAWPQSSARIENIPK